MCGTVYRRPPSLKYSIDIAIVYCIQGSTNYKTAVDYLDIVCIYSSAQSNNILQTYIAYITSNNVYPCLYNNYYNDSNGFSWIDSYFLFGYTVFHFHH